MATIKPFMPLRPLSRFAGAVVAPPYDSVSLKEAERIVWSNPLSFLKVLRPEITLPFYSNSKEKVYAEARKELILFLKKGIFVRESSPRFYLYTEIRGNIRQSGIVGLFSCSEYGKVIKSSEDLRASELNDRLQWIKHTEVQSGPVFLIYKKENSLQNIVSKILNAFPTYDFITEDNVRHIVHSISDTNTIDAVRKAFRNIRSLYIADGNHRTYAACTASKKYSMPPYFIGAAVPASEAHLTSYNRLIKDFNGFTEREFLKRIEKYFYIEVSERFNPPASKYNFSLYVSGWWFYLTVREKFVNADFLGVFFLEKHVFNEILCLNSRKDKDRIKFVVGNDVRAVDKGEWKALFVLYPLTVSELMNVADRGIVLPPKSTWFEPKFRSGLFLYPLRDIKDGSDNTLFEEEFNLWI